LGAKAPEISGLIFARKWWGERSRFDRHHSTPSMAPFASQRFNGCNVLRIAIHSHSLIYPGIRDHVETRHDRGKYSQSRGIIAKTCGKNFAHKETYITSCCEEKAQFAVSDILPACWQKKIQRMGWRARAQRVHLLVAGVYSHAPPMNPFKKKRPSPFFCANVIGLNDPKIHSDGYILAVMLETQAPSQGAKSKMSAMASRVFVTRSDFGDRFHDRFRIPELEAQPA